MKKAFVLKVVFITFITIVWDAPFVWSAQTPKNKGAARTHRRPLMSSNVQQSFIPQVSKPPQTTHKRKVEKRPQRRYCTPQQERNCIYKCQQACVERPSLRPFATKEGVVRVTSVVCSQDCRTLCKISIDSLKKERRGTRSPLVYYILDFYHKEGCVPQAVSFWEKVQTWVTGVFQSLHARFKSIYVRYQKRRLRRAVRVRARHKNTSTKQPLPQDSASDSTQHILAQ